MYCKKCGTEQRDGQKFCSKCGEPFLDENGKPYLKGIRKDMQDAKDKLATKAEELTQKGKKFLDEKVQPQLNEKIEEVKNADWNKKQAEATSFIKEFIKNPSKIRLATKILACIFVLWFFIKVGFSASVLWYVLIAAILFLAFMEPKAIKNGTMSSKYMYIGSCFVLMLIVALGGEKGNSDNSFSLFGGSSRPREICVSMDAEVANNRDRGGSAFELEYGNGNYGVYANSMKEVFTDVITIPDGKKWKFDRQETNIKGFGGRYPLILHYYRSDAKGSYYHRYRTYEDARTMPVFRSGDRIRIKVSCNYVYEGQKMTLDTKLYFIEVDDEFVEQGH